ncbi:hypothetical protein V6Z11_D05G019900 [Gossypium hirsutum]
MRKKNVKFKRRVISKYQKKGHNIRSDNNLRNKISLSSKIKQIKSISNKTKTLSSKPPTKKVFRNEKKREKKKEIESGTYNNPKKNTGIDQIRVNSSPSKPE